jgi:hypothetical protein
MVAAKVERLSIAFGVESGCLVHGHSADGVFGHGLRFFHGHVPFLVVVCRAKLWAIARAAPHLSKLAWNDRNWTGQAFDSTYPAARPENQVG